VGRNGRPFTVVKFRTMCENAEQLLHELAAQNEQAGPLFKIRRDPRMTRVGRILRKTSLDELPQLFNVIRGEMSLVGPRPPLPREVVEYSTYQLRRLAATPGMTGLWQVSGRSTLGFDEMVALDLRYISGWTFGRDISILLRTIPAVLSTRGAY
jgi:lipopolysaccharide/colanic/teichoic acid biosynthesis glycosyltransferase